MRNAVIMFTALVGFTAPVAAQEASALIEDVNSKTAGVEFMDYVAPGKVIQLGSSDTLVLSYLRSCWRETITGGTVTIGVEESAIKGGKVTRDRPPCDGGKLQLTASQSAKSGTMVFRSAPVSATALPAAQRTLFGLAPIIELAGGGKVVLERLDQPGEKLEIDVPTAKAGSRSVYDFAKENKALAAGGLYRVTATGGEAIVKIDPKAKPGAAPISSRLLRIAG